MYIPATSTNTPAYYVLYISTAIAPIPACIIYMYVLYNYTSQLLSLTHRMATTVWRTGVCRVAATWLPPLVPRATRPRRTASAPACPTWTPLHALHHCQDSTSGTSITSSTRLKRQHYQRWVYIHVYYILLCSCMSAPGSSL